MILKIGVCICWSLNRKMGREKSSCDVYYECNEYKNLQRDFNSPILNKDIKFLHRMQENGTFTVEFSATV